MIVNVKSLNSVRILIGPIATPPYLVLHCVNRIVFREINILSEALHLRHFSSKTSSGVNDFDSSIISPYVDRLDSYILTFPIHLLYNYTGNLRHLPNKVFVHLV